eukprot:1841474-Prymnesium_polylepis.1
MRTWSPGPKGCSRRKPSGVIPSDDGGGSCGVGPVGGDWKEEGGPTDCSSSASEECKDSHSDWRDSERLPQ